uniref:Uncharacterized protein n=1 Tax=Cucumis melo TaxID=3656 RepID=A0A9I9D499_CUCME
MSSATLTAGLDLNLRQKSMWALTASGIPPANEGGGCGGRVVVIFGSVQHFITNGLRTKATKPFGVKIGLHFKKNDG